MKIVEISDGSYCKVVATERLYKVIGKFVKRDRQTWTRMEGMLNKYAEYGGDFFNEEQFRAEGRFPTKSNDGQRVMVWAFKLNQLRLYGCKDDNGNLILLTEMDVKKQRKADQGKLRNAATEFGAYLEGRRHE